MSSAPSAAAATQGKNVQVEKHAGYCAAIRLGFDVPATWLLPHKVPPGRGGGL
jgi:hypothetical protein